MEIDRIYEIFHALEKHGVRYKVVGGVALNLVGIPRATQDLDLFIACAASSRSRNRMPIRKLRSLPDDDESNWMAPDDPRLLPTIKSVWALSAKLCPPSFPPGLYKHRSIDEMNRQTEEWERQTVERQSKAQRR